jgi:hypothetical protein
MVEAFRWERARKAGKVKIPGELMAPCMPPLQAGNEVDGGLVIQ